MSTHQERTPVDQDARDLIRTAHDRTLFVQAGAGTGKTTALVMRVVEMVATGHLGNMAGLAAITFTENAAAELRTRIREALEQAASDSEENQCDGAHRERCRAALASLDEATISTLHGFAARILSEVPLEAGVPPGFSVSDAVTAQIDGARAWRGFLDDLLDDGTVHDHVVAGLTLGLSLTRLRELATSFAANWDQLLPTTGDPVDKPFEELPLPAVDAAGVVTPLQQALEVLGHAPEGDGLTDLLRDTVQPAVAELLLLHDRFDVLEALHRLQLPTKRFPGKAPAWKSHPGGKQAVVDLLVQACEAREALLSGVGVAVTETLCARVQDFVLEEAGRRRAEGRLEFHDLLVLTRDVLRADAAVRRRMHGRFRVLMVDEFQDTDPLQVEIVCLIAGDCGVVPPERWEDLVPTIPAGKVFYVGDPKQSIYRFRRADVTLFGQVGALHDASTSLAVNFRSVRGVVEPVNRLFTGLMKDAPDQVEYADLQWHRAGGETGRVTLLGGPDPDAKATELREREAAHVAALIGRAHSEAWPVSAEGGSRPLRYADVAILLPTRTSLPALEEALQDVDVPYRVESRSLVWATDAVRDVVTLLQALVNPADEVAIVAALRHHGLACSDVALTEWAAARGRWDYLAPAPDEIPPDHPVAAGMAQLRAWHDLRWWLPVNHLVERIVRELRLVELTAELRRPRDHWRRLRFVVDQARAFCDAGGTGLTEFVAWAVQQIESEADVLETAVPEPDDDSVRILTVHGSKGLEFPLTVLAGLGAPRPLRAEVLWDGDRPEARLKSKVLESAGWADQLAAEKALDQAEGIRLLYVAMTRAQDYLVVGCYHRPVKGPKSAPSHAQCVVEGLAELDLPHEPEMVPFAGSVRAASGTDFGDVTDRDAFARSREELLAAVRAKVATSATALAAQTEPGVRMSPPVARQIASVSGVAEPEPEPTAPAAPGQGAAIGSAVHRVLELVDLAGPDDAELSALAGFACDEQGIPELADEVGTRVRNALSARVVAAAGASGRFWREVYVVSRDGERYVEGYIDLLVEDDDGLHVVDYKTDRVNGFESLVAKALRYAPQLGAYGAAVGQVPGLAVPRGSLLFLDGDAARQVDINVKSAGQR